LTASFSDDQAIVTLSVFAFSRCNFQTQGHELFNFYPFDMNFFLDLNEDHFVLSFPLFTLMQKKNLIAPSHTKIGIFFSF
jgi:hypothetical protein